MLMKTQIGQTLWRDAIPEEVTEADHANDDRTLWSRKFASKKQNDLVENAPCGIAEKRSLEFHAHASILRLTLCMQYL